MAWKPSKEDILASVLVLVQCRNHINRLIETKKLYTGDKEKLHGLAMAHEALEEALLVRYGRRLLEDGQDIAV